MRDFPEEAAPWASAAAAPPDEDVLEMGTWAADAIHLAHFKQAKAAPARNAPTLVANLLRYGPYAALTACLLGVAWLAWSHLDRPARTVIQPESVRSDEMGQAVQKMAEEHHAQKAEVEALPAVQSLSAEDVTGLGNTKPRLDAPKTERTAPIAEVSGKVERLPPKSPKKLSKASERFDPIGHEIAALLAAAPVADRAVSAAPVARKRAHDAFDPSKNPTAPGAPRPLGTIAPAATPNNSAAEIAYGQRAN